MLSTLHTNLLGAVAENTISSGDTASTFTGARATDTSAVEHETEVDHLKPTPPRVVWARRLLLAASAGLMLLLLLLTGLCAAYCRLRHQRPNRRGRQHQRVRTTEADADDDDESVDDDYDDVPPRGSRRGARLAQR